MREILFRGKRIDNGEWVEGFYFERKDTQGQIIEAIIIEDAYEQVTGGQRYIRSDLNHDCYRVDPVTVGQYTGLQDKNGKRIFEGDVIQMNDNPKDLAVIRFGEFSCVDIELEAKVDRVHGWYFKPLHTDDLSALEPFCWEMQLNQMWVKECGVEVVGNIHDNKELGKIQE